jgi:hypothetical protein
MAMLLFGLIVLIIVVAVVLPALERLVDPAERAAHTAAVQRDMEQDEALAPLVLLLKGALLIALILVALGAGTGGGAFLALKGLAAGLNAWRYIPAIFPNRQGAYPAIVQGQGALDTSHIDSRATIMLATVNGNVDRLPGSGMREAIRPPELPAPEIPQISISPNQMLDNYDPQREPHWLLIGQTGAGKSKAIFAIAQHLANRYPSEFLIMERGGVDWNTQAAARSVPGYAEALAAVEGERQRRVELLRAADVDHVSRLAEPPPMLVVIVEEAESVYGQLFTMDRERAKLFMATLRDLASLGRKQGVVMIVATQTGTTGVFDGPTRRNLGNTLIFRSEYVVGDQFGVPREAGLPMLPSGTAYAPKYGCPIEFPLLARPTLRPSALYYEPLQLAGDAEADGLGAADQPDGPTVATVATVHNWPQEGVDRAVAPVARIDTGRQPTPDEAIAMRRHYERTGSKTSVCRHFYGYKDDVVWDYVNQALEGRL